MSLTNLSIINVIFFFFINLVICTISRKHLTYKGISIFVFFLNLIFFLSNCHLWSFFVLESKTEIFDYKLNSNNWTSINYEIALKINSLNFLFVFLVNIIGFCANIYILNYFKHEDRLEEFILLINWFIFSMVFLVISNNFFCLILGWELIGLTSFLLINFWKFKSNSLSCSFKAFMFNKISDVFLIIGCAILWNKYKINNIDILLNNISLNDNSNSLFFAGFCIIMSTCIKSAQIIGHLWLPESMEAPVPASALIHSATLVSAGIYILLKFNIIFILTGLNTLILIIGSFTAFYGGIVAVAQSDMKKLLAYSTISHCGFIFASVALNNFTITIIYLYFHGLFKAMSFFCSGSIIKINNTQDSRAMGSIKNQVIHIISLIITVINLGGVPFTLGYIYKLLFLNFVLLNCVNIFSYGFLVVGILCSIVYVFKIIYYSCFDYRKGSLSENFLLLQGDKTPYKNQLNFTNFIYIAFIIILIFSFFFFLIIKSYILKNFFFLFNNNKIMINNYLFLNKRALSNSLLISSFYRLFVFTMIIIFVLCLKKVNTISEINEMILLISGMLLILVIGTTILYYFPNKEPTTCFEYLCKKIFKIFKYLYNNLL